MPVASSSPGFNRANVSGSIWTIYSSPPSSIGCHPTSIPTNAVPIANASIACIALASLPQSFRAIGFVGE
jgi:hypothetical protein